MNQFLHFHAFFKFKLVNNNSFVHVSMLHPSFGLTQQNKVLSKLILLQTINMYTYKNANIKVTYGQRIKEEFRKFSQSCIHQNNTSGMHSLRKAYIQVISVYT